MDKDDIIAAELLRVQEGQDKIRVSGFYYLKDA